MEKIINYYRAVGRYQELVNGGKEEGDAWIQVKKENPGISLGRFLRYLTKKK